MSVKTALDYEREKLHLVTVTARDATAHDSRIATTTVTIEVEDVEDEEPVSQLSFRMAEHNTVNELS